MWAYALVVAMVSVFAFFLGDAGQAEAARSRTLAESMAVYRTAVLEMVRAQPSFEGPVSDSALSLPAWWQRRPGIEATVQGRMVAVYITGIEQGNVLEEMLHLAGGSILVGLASHDSGTLKSPLIGDTGISVPSSVPDGAPVWLATRD
jgi:hypothetical protein